MANSEHGLNVHIFSLLILFQFFFCIMGLDYCWMRWITQHQSTSERLNPFRKLMAMQYSNILASSRVVKWTEKKSFLHIIYFYSFAISIRVLSSSAAAAAAGVACILVTTSYPQKTTWKLNCASKVYTRIISSILKFPFVYRMFKNFAYFFFTFPLFHKFSRNLFRWKR